MELCSCDFLTVIISCFVYVFCQSNTALGGTLFSDIMRVGAGCASSPRSFECSDVCAAVKSFVECSSSDQINHLSCLIVDKKICLFSFISFHSDSV